MPTCPVECPAYLRVPWPGLATVAVVQKRRSKSPGCGPSLVYPGFRNPGSHPGCDRGLSIPGLQPGFATCPIPGFSRVVLLGVVEPPCGARSYELDQKIPAVRWPSKKPLELRNPSCLVSVNTKKAGLTARGGSKRTSDMPLTHPLLV